MKCLVVMLYRCRLDYLSCYGCDWIATPTIDRLAAEGVVFDQHYAESLRQPASLRPLNQPHLPGDTSLAFIGDDRSSNRDLMADCESAQIIMRNRLATLEQDSLLGGVVQTAIEWLQGAARLPSWLLWLEIGAFIPPWDQAERDDEAILEEPAEPIEPWLDPPVSANLTEKDQERLERTYAGVVGGVDQWLGMLVDFLRESGLLDELLLIVTSDVGLALGDRGTFDPDLLTLHQEHVHLPLIMRLPKAEHAGKRVHQFTYPRDVGLAIQRHFGAGQDVDQSARDLLGVIRGTAGRAREFATCDLADGHDSLRTHQWRLVLEEGNKVNPLQLYVKPDDRFEVSNVASQHLAVAEHLELALRRYRRQPNALPPELRADVLNVLQS